VRSRLLVGSSLTKIALALVLFGIFGRTVAWAQTSPSSSAPDDPGFAQYMVDHQAEVDPFISKNSKQIVQQAVPLVLEWVGKIVLLALLAGWIIDVALSRGFADLFARSRRQLTRSLIYASVRLVLSAIIVMLLGITLALLAGLSNLEYIVPAVCLLFFLIGAGVQIGWIYYLYRTDVFISGLFFLVLLIVHGFATLVIAVPLMGGQAGHSGTAFIDHTLTVGLQAEVEGTRQDLARITPARDAAAVEVNQLHDEIDQAKAEQIEVQKQILAAKSSETYAFSQIVKTHARGDLQAAHDQFTSFLVTFPNGALTGLAKGQLMQVDSELAAQDAQKKQAAADAIRLAAQQRADLLLRAGKGLVPLSEMRRTLLGKTRAEVSGLFGPPTEIASDRWGFAQQMIFNSLTNQKSGLAIYFNDGVVQSVDYYSGAAP